MKLIPVIVLACSIALSAFHSAYAACAIDDPAAVAKSFYSKHVNFSSEDPAKSKKIITPHLFDAVDREYKCAQGQICAIEADPWTDAAGWEDRQASRVRDGQQLWIYYPKFQSAEHYSLGKHSPLDAGIEALTAALNLENVENNYHIGARHLEHGYELQLAPRNPSLKRLLKTFSIQMNPDLQVERTEMIQPNGDHIVTLYSHESRAAIDPSNFEFTPPAGTNVTTPLGR